MIKMLAMSYLFFCVNVQNQVFPLLAINNFNDNVMAISNKWLYSLLPYFINEIINYFWQYPISFLGRSRSKLEVGQPQYKAWSDCTGVQAGLAMYWGQSLINLGFGRIRVNNQC